ncbi:MAG: hypothetical protein WCG75_07875 [Armatimonadota bacterium]
MRKWAFLSIGLYLVGCGGAISSSSNGLTHNYLGTQAPGDVWSWQINESTFTATNPTLGLHYSGTKSSLSTGFMKLTVDTTDDSGVTPGQSAYALELSGTALLIKPVGDDTKPPIVASSLGSNPPGPTVKFNYVAIGKLGFNQATDQAYGNANLTVTGNHYTGPTHQWNINGAALADGTANLTGNNGLMTDLNGPSGVPVTGAMTPSGVCVLDYGPNFGGVIGVKQPAANIDLTDLASRHFKGFLINQGKTQCVDVTSNGDGTLHGQGYALPTGVEDGTFDGGGGPTLSFTAQPNPGEVTVRLAFGSGFEDMVAAINVVGGKYMLFCFGVGEDGKPYNVVLVEI